MFCILSCLRKKIWHSTVILLFSSLSFLHTYAADLSLKPLTKVPRLGAPLSVGVYIENNTSAVNAASLDIRFNTSSLSAQSISKKDTLIQMWSENPRFSNGEGTAHVEGVILNPGFAGKSGLLATVIFTPKKEGKTELILSNAHIYANDGSATDVIRMSYPLTVTIGPKVFGETKEVRTEEDVATSSQPAKLTTGPIDADQKVTLDEQSQVVSSSTSLKVNQTLVIEDAYDKPKYTKYVLSLNGKEKIRVDASILGKTLVPLPKANLRMNILDIMAYDAYGGVTNITVPFYVEPLTPPILLSLTRSVKVNESVTASLRSEVGGSVRVTLKNEASLFIGDTTVGEDGVATLSIPVTSVGTYKGTARLYKNDGESEEVKLGDVVVKPTIMWFFSSNNPSLSLFFMIALLVILILILSLVVMVLVRRYRRMVTEANNLLFEGIQKQISAEEGKKGQI